jgi:LPS sulfotransferase NodH
MPTFIFMSRNDLLSQAISYVIARQTHVWTSDQALNGNTKLTYDRAAILRALKGFATTNAQFRAYFAVFGVSPLCLYYEDFVRNPSAGVEAIFNWMDMPGGQFDETKISIRQQRNELNEEWRSRFLSESKRYLDESFDAPNFKQRFMSFSHARWRRDFQI